MKFIRFSVNHPVTTCMIMLGLMMGGLFSFSRMEVELLPSISIPTLVVITEIPRTSPEKVHQEVTLPLEETLNSVGDLVSVNSISFEGESRIILEFDWGCNLRSAEVEVREQINALKLPVEAYDPLVKKFDPSSAPIFRFDILGENLSTIELREIAETEIKPRLERLSGVGEVEILGGTDPEYQVIGQRDRLAQYNLTVLSLVRCVATESRNRKGGTISVEGGSTASLRIPGKANSVEDLENLIVSITPTGTPIRIKDVAKVIRTNKKPESYARIDGAPSVGLSIRKTSGASVVTVAERVKAEIEKIAPALENQGASLRISQDDSEYVLNSQSLVANSIVQGVIFAGALLFLFLRDIRATIVVAITTPISILTAAIFLHAFGISRNIQTLGGLGLAAGMTLDGSIVLIDSIYKQLSMGRSPREAAIRGGSEVVSGIFSSTMTTVAVFLPILLIPGLMQEVFKSLAHAIIWSVLSSMVVGILFIPMISARILSAPVPADKQKFIPWKLFLNFMSKSDDIAEGTLSRVLNPLLKSTFLKAAIVFGLMAISALSLKFLPGRGFFPPGNVQELWVRFEPPPGASLDFVDERMTRVEKLLQTAPYNSFVKSVSADIRNDEGRLFVRLFPNEKVSKRDQYGNRIEGFEQIRPEEWHTLSDCVTKIREGCESIPDLSGNTFVSLVDKIRGRSRAPIIFKVYSKELDPNKNEAEQLRGLQEVAEQKFLPKLEAIPAAIYQRVKINRTPEEFLISTKENKESLVEKGITTQQISDTVRASVYGVEAATVLVNGSETDVTVFLEDSNASPNGEFDREAIESLRIRSASTGLLHEIMEVAEVTSSPSEGSIVLERTNRKPTVNLESDFGPYNKTGETIGDVTDKIEESLLSIPGFKESYDYRIESEARDTVDSFSEASLAFVISVILIYMIMCSQFEKFLDPLAIMITVPLAATGSVILLNVMGEIFSLGAYVAAVILCGIVVNNGIILVEFINILRKRGVHRNEAIVQGAIRKLRSVLITSLTSIMGMAPLALGVGEGTELYRSVAAVVVGGLIASTPLTIIALPLFYSLLDEISEFFSSLGFRFKIAGEKLLGENI